MKRSMCVFFSLMLQLVFVPNLRANQLAELHPAEALSQSGGDRNLCRTTFEGPIGVQGINSEKLRISLADSNLLNSDSDNQELDQDKLGEAGEEILQRFDQLMVGNHEVKLALARAVQRAAMGTNNAKRPVAIFLLLGVTGTGKTLTAEALVKALGLEDNALIKISGGEQQERHSTSKITSAPAGYVGHDDTAPLVNNETLAKATSPKYKVNVMLVDELEKANASLRKLLLGVFDKGKLTDGKNRIIDFTHTIILLTSNLGQAEMEQILKESRDSGETSAELDRRLREAAMAAIGELPPEFRNRIDRTFVYPEYTYDEALEVLNLNLASAQRERLFDNANTRVLFNVTPKAREFIMGRYYEPEFGGRSINRGIDSAIIDPITNMIGSGQLRSGDLVNVEVRPDGSGLSYQLVARDVPEEKQASLYAQMYGPDVPPLSVASASAPAQASASNSSETDKDVNLSFKELLSQLKRIKDDRTKLNLINRFVINSTGYSADVFLQLYQKLPKENNWGAKNGTVLTDAMRSEGIADFENMDFEPIRLRFFYLGLTRIDSIAPWERWKLKGAIENMFSSAQDYLSKESSLGPQFILAYDKLLLREQARIMALPSPTIWKKKKSK